jgi:hypothetical protein
MNFSDGKPLTALCDNVLASRLGKAYRTAQNGKFYPDSIDAGLELLKLLNEAGFEVTEKQKC